jgi:hypothetical protein
MERLTEVNARQVNLPQRYTRKGRPGCGRRCTMRGKKTALAIIVMLLIAGGVFNHYVPDYDVTAADDEQTQVTEGAAANVK